MFVETKEAGEQQIELDEPGKVLLKAAELIEERGHCKFRTQDEQGRFCYIGALSEAAGLLSMAGKHFFTADARFHQCLGMCPIDWNNAAERTGEEVVAKLRAVALGL